jgi:hypothetical protein
MQWLIGVPMLHHLGLAMVRYRVSGADVSGFLWCGCIPMDYQLIIEPLTFFRSVRNPDGVYLGST